MICVNNLNFYSAQKRQILKNISFTLQKGEVLSILGCNGAGKTTLLKCLIGFLKPQSGEVRLQDKPISCYSHKQLWQILSYVPQSKGLAFDFKVLDMVALGLNAFVNFKPSKTHYLKARETLEWLNLLHLEHKNCASLSGGELQMVMFARTLVKEPQILILDEPESNLDFFNQKTILECLKSLKECSIILNTHFPNHAAYLSHKVLLLHKLEPHHTQTNALFGTKIDMLNSQSLSELYNVPVSIDSQKSQNEQYMLRI